MRFRLLATAICVLALSGCAGSPRVGDADLPNFRQVTPTLYRGAQPTAAGLARARDMGIKTVVNVRESDDDRVAATDLGLNCEQRSMSAWSPSDDDVAWFLSIATDPQRQPVFLHCQHGADRSGYRIAMDRVVILGWDRQRAIDEMTADGMGFHDIYQVLVDYVRNADVERIRGLIAAE